MTTAPDEIRLAATVEPAFADVTALVPSREALLDRLAEHLQRATGQPTSLIVLGLLRRDDGRPIPRSTLARVTTLLARSVRGEDWLALPGPAEFGILLAGSVPATRTVAVRLVTAVANQDIPGLWAAAGVAPLDARLTANEVFRRAALSLTAARRAGAGTVIVYREPA